MSAVWYRVFRLELRFNRNTQSYVQYLWHVSCCPCRSVCGWEHYCSSAEYICSKHGICGVGLPAHRDWSNHTNQATTAHVTWNLKLFYYSAVTTPSYLVDTKSPIMCIDDDAFSGTNIHFLGLDMINFNSGWRTSQHNLGKLRGVPLIKTNVVNILLTMNIKQFVLSRK